MLSHLCRHWYADFPCNTALFNGIRPMRMDTLSALPHGHQATHNTRLHKGYEVKTTWPGIRPNCSFTHCVISSRSGGLEEKFQWWQNSLNKGKKTSSASSHSSTTTAIFLLVSHFQGYTEGIFKQILRHISLNGSKSSNFIRMWRPKDDVRSPVAVGCSIPKHLTEYRLP